MMYTRFQNYTIVMVDEYGSQTFEVVVVVFVPTSAPPLLCLDKWFVQIYLNYIS